MGYAPFLEMRTCPDLSQLSRPGVGMVADASGNADSRRPMSGAVSHAGELARIGRRYRTGRPGRHGGLRLETLRRPSAFALSTGG
jgi:hypothetical protein